MLTKEIINKEFEKVSTIEYHWSKSFKSKSSYGLFITIGNCGYQVASYSLKTKRIILNCPEIHIPQASVLEKFIEYVSKKGE
jgi:hypothetical protein